jgi:hypothetical protein
VKPALIRRLPRLRYNPPAVQPLVPEGARGNYPQLRSDLNVVDATLQPAFATLDAEAGKAQNRHRLLRLAIILGATTATLLGVWQTADDGAAVAGVLETIVSGAVAALAWLMRKRRYHRKFLHTRLAAERLRAECFLFLARTSGYEGDSPSKTLVERVKAIERDSGAT